MNFVHAKIKRTFSAASFLVLIAAMVVSLPAQGAIVEVLDYDLTQNPDSGSGTHADPFTYDVTGPISGDLFTVEIFAFTTGGGAAATQGADPFIEATGVKVPNGDDGFGIGVCTTIESDPDLSECASDDELRAINSSKELNEIDWLLVIFPEYIGVNTFELTPENREERDVVYYTGRIDDYTDLLGDNPNNLPGFVSGNGWNPVVVRDDLGKGDKAKDKDDPLPDQSITVDASGHEYKVNALLIGAYQEVQTNKGKQKVKGKTEVTLTNVNVSTVPIPAAVWMFGSALGALLFGRKLNSRNKD